MSASEDKANWGAGGYLQVVDLEGFGMGNVDRGVLKDLGGLTERYFPGRILMVHVVRAPVVVYGLWRMLRPMVPNKWLSVISFSRKAIGLADALGTQALPVAFGGDLAALDVDTWLRKNRTAIVENHHFELAECVASEAP